MTDDWLKECVGAAVASGKEQAARPKPINYRKKKKKKKRRIRYTRGTADLQRLARGSAKASERVAKAVRKGLREYNRQSGKSRRRSRDGAIVDGLVNAADGFAEFAGEAAQAPSHIAKRIPTPRLWKYVRPR